MDLAERQGYSQVSAAKQSERGWERNRVLVYHLSLRLGLEGDIHDR
jgi:hypothetical protein